MTTENDFVPKKYTAEVDNGSFEWSAPSNIALIKYWGKKPHQIPANPSLSFTLTNCKTITKLSFERKPDPNDEFSFELIFNGEPKESFKPKVARLFERIHAYLPFLTDYHFTIETQNTFPHSSGIASSASAMAALALNFMSIEKVLHPEMTDEYFYRKASFLARLGSGSACRSVLGPIVVWGEHAGIDGSSNLYGVPYKKEIHPVFMHCLDAILLVDKGEKQVSSTVGHELMYDHPYAETRFAQAHANLSKLDNAMQEGDISEFIAIVESEALTLHSMMMTSRPYYMLMKPNTLKIINRIWEFRRETNTPVCFTLDAGANVHVLFPENVKEKVLDFIATDLAKFCQDGQYIVDEVGDGARLINN